MVTVDISQGFGIVESVLSSEECVEIAAELTRLSDGGPSLRNLLAVERIRALATDDRILEFVRTHLGTSARAVRGIYFDKTPAANWKVPWHQDLTIAVASRSDVAGFGPWSVKDGVPHVQPPAAVLESMLTVRLHLDPCGPDNGPLRVLPNTHRLGKLPERECESLARELPEVACTVGLGGIVLMRPLTVHASSPATAPEHRRVVHLEYAAGELPAPLAWAFGQP